VSRSPFQDEFSADRPTTLVAGALRGYRQWEVTLDMKLKAVTQNHIWHSPMRAICRHPDTDHRAPDRDCSCGIYACHRPDDDQLAASSVLHPGCVVTGVIEAWGRVEVGQRGFRAQHTRIVALEYAMPTQANLVQALGESRYIFDERRRTELPDGRVVKTVELVLYLGHPRKWEDKLAEHYPAVQVFADRAAMVRAYPPVDVSGLLPR
jgi:hypothetical protein